VDDVVAQWETGKRAEARALVGTDVIGDLSVVGPAQSVPEQLERFVAIGIDIPILRFPDGLEPSGRWSIAASVATRSTG